MWLAIKTKTQSPTNRACGRFQDCVGGRSEPLCLLLPHIIPLIIIGNRLAPNQEKGLVTSLRKRNSRSQGLIFLWLPFFSHLMFCLFRSPHLSHNPQVSEKVWGEKTSCHRATCCSYVFQWTPEHYLSIFHILYCEWVLSSQQQLYRDIIRREQV